MHTPWLVFCRLGRVNGEIIMSKDLGSHRLVTMSLGREIDPPRHIVDPEIMKQNQTQKNKIQELQAANNEKDEIIDKFGTRLRMCLRFMARQGDKQINELDRAGLLDYDTPARIQVNLAQGWRCRAVPPPLMLHPATPACAQTPRDHARQANLFPTRIRVLPPPPLPPGQWVHRARGQQ